MDYFVFVCDFGSGDHFVGMISQRLSLVIDFSVMDPLAVDEFLDLCDELVGPF